MYYLSCVTSIRSKTYFDILNFLKRFIVLKTRLKLKSHSTKVLDRIMFRANLCGMASRFTMSLATWKLYGWWVPTIAYFMEVL